MHTFRPILTGRHYGWITLGFVAFVVYGSLVPLNFRSVAFEIAWQRFTRAFARPIAIDQPSDWLANILLFIPLGFLTMGWRRVDRQGISFGVVLWVLPAFALLSALLELAQIWFPPRHTSPNDVVAETIGGILGVTFWLIGGQRITDICRRIWSIYAVRNWAVRLIPAYLALLVFVFGMPFDLTLSPSSLKAKYRHRDRLLRPVPFTLARDEPLDLAKKAIVNTAWFFPGGLLLAGLPGRALRRRGAGWRVLGIGVVTAGGIELMQLFVVSRYFDATDIVTGAFAVWAGWRVARAWQASHEPSHRFQDGLHRTLALIWMAALIFFHWEPFDFETEAPFIAERWQQLALISYRGRVGPGSLFIFNDMLQKIVLFLPLGLFLSCRPGNRFDRVVTTGVALVISLSLEVGEFFLRHHQQPGVSDLFVEPFGAWLGCLAFGRLSDFKERTLNEPLPIEKLRNPHHLVEGAR